MSSWVVSDKLESRQSTLRVTRFFYEVNEAFASIPLAWLKHVGTDPVRMNVSGGAISLGHPLGVSGTKLMTTSMHGLHRTRGRFGLQTMCEGGGLANVTLVERL
jgi:acetyl-CoA C-acetyltransferase